MEDIPNKIKASMGIIVDVKLRNKQQKSYLELVVSAYSTPISYHGKYYYRSGSTLQELTGAALNKFLLLRHGKKRDSVPVPEVKISDLKQETIEFFRKLGLQSKRLNESTKMESIAELIENLQLTENHLLKRACILLFYPNPERFIT
jgi:ATP-dependent DNA helicase RecG